MRSLPHRLRHFFPRAAASINFSNIAVAIFVTFFGLMMTCLECNVGNLAPMIKRNFGFLFSFVGRAIFILFCATLCYAFNNWLGWIVGSVTAVNALFNAYVICVHPSFRSGELSAAGNPYGGYTGGESEMLAYLKKNPQLAQKATGAAVTFAQNNPDVAMQVATAAAQPRSDDPVAAGSNPWGGRS